MMDWTSIVVALIGSGAIAALVTLVGDAMRRRWRKQDEMITPERITKLECNIDALKKCLKVMSVDRIHYLGLSYIEARSVTLEEKETLHEMHDAYKALGGNGHLDAVMQEVDRLQIARTRIRRDDE